MKRRTRILLGFALAIALLLCGFLAGAVIASQFFVPAGSGLAGPGIVFGYGIIGAVIGVVLAIVLAIWLTDRWLIRALIGFGAGATIVAVLGLGAYWKASDETAAHLEEAYRNLPAFSVSLEQQSKQRPYERLDLDWGNRRYTAAIDGQLCTAEISGKEAVKMLTALRNIDAILLQDGDPCAGIEGVPELHVEWTIKEAMPPDSQGSLALTRACLEQHPGLATPFDAAADLLNDGDFRQKCE